jgi:hypothetical protein
MNRLKVLCLGVLSPNAHISLAYWRLSSLLQSLLPESLFRARFWQFHPKKRSDNDRLRTDGIASKRINNKAKSIERTGKRGLPLPLLTYSASIRPRVSFISILENNNLRVSRGSPRNRFKPDYHLHLDLIQLSLDTLTPINLTKQKTTIFKGREHKKN